MQHAPLTSAYPALGARRVRAIGLGVVTGVFLSLTTAAQSATPPVNLSRPVITGTVELGETLHASPGRWLSPAPLGYTFRWWRCPTANRCSRSTLIARPHLPDHGRGTSAGLSSFASPPSSRLGVARASSPLVAIPNPGAGPPPKLLFRDKFDRPGRPGHERVGVWPSR